MEVNEQLAALLEKQTAILEGMAKQKAAGATGDAVELHGVGSLFGSHSIEREVVSAHIRPFGLGARLPVFPTVYEQPFFAGITGVTADSGSEPTEPCDDAPRAYLKGCDLTAQFGRVQRDTGTIEINDVMLRKNRGDFTDLRLYGELIGESGFTPSNITSEGVLNIVTKAEMITATISLERLLSQHLWQGHILNNAGAYKEFPGLMYQVATGQMDAHTGTLCPAMDSDVKDFGYQDVEDRNSLRDIVEHLSYLEAYLQFNAEHMGLQPLQLVMALRPELWYVLSAIWPCAYNTAKCAVMDSSNIDPVPNLDAAAMVRIRDDMRNGMYIDINGRRIPVVTDTGIFEHNNQNNGSLEAGEYASSIFMLPLSAGGLTTLYMEHVDYRAAQPDVNLLRGTQEFWTDDGKYYWAIEHAKWCYKLSVKSEQRVILRTPQLAGRIDSIKYIPTQHFRSPYPDDPYFVDGGVSMRSDTFTHHVW
jgi:hypothetical protein